MSEAISFPQESRVSLRTIEAQNELDQNGNEFLDESEKVALIAAIQEGQRARSLLNQDGLDITDRGDLEEIVQAGHDAESAIVETHTRLANKIARAHYATGMSSEDLLQHATIGLLRAARTFDPSKKIEFKKYAGICIREEVRKSIANTGRFIDIPENEFWLARKIPGAEEEFKRDNGRLPTDDELAKVLDAKVTQIIDLRPMVNDAIAVLDAPLGDDTSITLKDQLSNNDDADYSTGSEVISDPRLRAALYELPEPKRTFLMMRYGLEEYPNMHPDDIGDAIGISPKSVFKTEARIRKHLRVIMESDMENVGTSEGEGHEEPGVSDQPTSREKREYDPFASPLLDIRDGSWLTDLMGRPPSTESLQAMNELIPAGSDRFYDGKKKLVTDTTKERNIAARERFFELLGWTEQTHPSYENFQAILQKQSHLPPLERFIFTQRAFALYGVKSEVVLNSVPRAIVWSHDTVLPRLQELQDIGLNVATTVHKWPLLLKYLPERLRETASVLPEYEVSADVLELDPKIFKVPPAELSGRLANLEENGFNVPEAVLMRDAVILSRKAELVNQRIDELEGVGLDAVFIISRDPRIITYKWSTLQLKFEALENLDLDWRRLIHAQPSLLQADIGNLSRRVELFQRLAHVLKWNGDVNELILAKPSVLQTAQSRLFFLAYMAAAHLPDEARDLPATQVADGIKTPIASHLLAATRPESPYSTRLAVKYSRAMSADVQRSALENILRKPDAAKQLGHKVIRAYNRHVAPKTS